MMYFVVSTLRRKSLKSNFIKLKMEVECLEVTVDNFTAWKHTFSCLEDPRFQGPSNIH